MDWQSLAWSLATIQATIQIHSGLHSLPKRSTAVCCARFNPECGLSLLQRGLAFGQPLVSKAGWRKHALWSAHRSEVQMPTLAISRFLLVALLAASPLLAAADTPADRAAAQAMQLVERMKNFDSEGAADLTYTRFLERMGIDPAMPRQASAQLNEQLKAVGARYTRFELGEPRQPFAGDGQLYVFIPYVQEMEARGKRRVQEAFFIGVSDDQGQSWKFVDGAAATPQNIKAVIPSYGGAPLPPKRQEVLDQ